jgi:hypothetical protein
LRSEPDRLRNSFRARLGPLRARDPSEDVTRDDGLNAAKLVSTSGWVASATVRSGGTSRLSTVSSFVQEPSRFAASTRARPADVMRPSRSSRSTRSLLARAHGLEYHMTEEIEPVAAIYPRQAEERRPIVYFDADDIDATVARVREMGGEADDKVPIRESDGSRGAGTPRETRSASSRPTSRFPTRRRRGRHSPGPTSSRHHR